MDWEKSFRKYVWDEQKTPYFTPVAKLSRIQADYEIYIFSLFLGILFAVVAVTALTGAGHTGRAPGVAIYAFSIVCAVIVLGASKHPHAALYCSTAPAGALLYFYYYGFHPNLGTIDHVVILVTVVLWARYSMRVIAIARRYASMPSGDPGDGTGEGGP